MAGCRRTHTTKARLSVEGSSTYACLAAFKRSVCGHMHRSPGICGAELKRSGICQGVDDSVTQTDRLQSGISAFIDRGVEVIAHIPQLPASAQLQTLATQPRLGLHARQPALRFDGPQPVQDPVQIEIFPTQVEPRLTRMPSTSKWVEKAWPYFRKLPPQCKCSRRLQHNLTSSVRGWADHGEVIEKM